MITVLNFEGFWCPEKRESPANAKGTCDSSARMKAHCEQM